MSPVYPLCKGDDERKTGVAPRELDIPDNYVTHTLKTHPSLLPFSWANRYNEMDWPRFSILILMPITGLIGAYYTKLRLETFVFSFLYAHLTGLGITAGYHRLWAHRSYNASKHLQYFLALMGTAALRGSIEHWSRIHRVHHRYVDTDLDPIGSTKGLFHTHIGWLLVKPRQELTVVDISDLSKNAIVQWQKRMYTMLSLLMGFILPTFICWMLWGDAKGGWVYASVLRLFFVQQADFCVNSLAHYFGNKSYDDEHTSRDNFITALVTLGEGYHNFHHQFPSDYRNAFKWYQYDPTKWFIWMMNRTGLASHLKVFSDNEVRKSELTMQLKKLHEMQTTLTWPSKSDEFPVIDWETFQGQALNRPLILVSGFIHDITGFADEHPGGPNVLMKMVGKDATTAFFGGIYKHSATAHNLLAMKRVGILHGEHSHMPEDKAIPPSQKLQIVRYDERNCVYVRSTGK